MQFNHFLLLKKFKNTESAQLYKLSQEKSQLQPACEFLFFTYSAPSALMG